MSKVSKQKLNKLFELEKDSSPQNKDEKFEYLSQQLSELSTQTDKNIVVSSENKKQKELYEKRKLEAEQIAKSIELLKKSSSDEEFIKENLKNLTTLCMTSLKQMQEEMLIDPSGRMGECMAALSNSVVNALKELNDIENKKKRISLEEEKLKMKKDNKPQGPTTQNVVVIGSITDALKLVKNTQQNIENNIKDITSENISASTIGE